MSGRFLLLTVFATVAALLCVVSAEQTCTAGRIFISATDSPTVHVYDLDESPATLVGSFPTVAAAMTMYASDTVQSRVLAVFGGNTTTGFQGRVHIFRSGLSTESHGDHFDIVKNAPGKYSYEFVGYKPAHFTASAGYLAMFYDGVWVQSTDGTVPAGVQPSVAEFVQESLFTEDSLTVTPTVTSIGGLVAHHGVAYALSDSAFIVSQPTEGRKNYTSTGSTPNGFVVYDAAGTATVDLNDPTNEDRNCSSAHGAAHIDNTVVFGCSTVGMLKVTYDPAGTTPASRIASTKVLYPAGSTVDGTVFRSSTIYSQDNNKLFVGNFNDAAGPVAPSHTIQVPMTATAGSVTTSNLITTKTTTARFCAYAVDKGAPETAGTTNVAYLAVDGKMYLTQVNASGLAITPTVSVQVIPVSTGSTITCSSYVLVAGANAMYVLSKNDGLMYTVSVEALAEGEPTGVVTSQQLPFKPASGAVSFPHGFDCVAAGHSHDDDGNHAAAGASYSIALLIALLAATLRAATL